MPCTTTLNMTAVQKSQQKEALARLDADLARGTVTVKVGSNGALAFKGWTNNNGISDLCAYRALSAANSPALRKALARAEAMAGRPMDYRAVQAGVHSHDGGTSWHKGH